MADTVNAAQQLSNLNSNDSHPDVSHYTTESSCLSMSPMQIERTARRRGATFTLMVVGESGLGKSTFIRTMFGREFTVSKVLSDTTSDQVVSMRAMVGETRKPEKELLSRAPKSVITIPSSNSHSVPPRADVHPTAEIEVYQALVVENGFPTNLTVIDTPGFGDYTNNDNTWVPVTNYIDAQHQHYMLQDEQPDRLGKIDTRVHCCLYFIAPTGRSSELDLTAMRELGSRVNLVPVIAKADSMTPEDLCAFKQYVREVLTENHVQVWTPEVTSPAEEAWPFALVSSERLVLNGQGEKVRGREYRWGVIEIENPAHSDFASLRDTSFRDNMLNLIDTTVAQHYQNLRRKSRLMRMQRAMGVFGSNQMDAEMPAQSQTEAQGQARNEESTQEKESQSQLQPPNGEQTRSQETPGAIQQEKPVTTKSRRLQPQDRPSLSFLSRSLLKTQDESEEEESHDAVVETDKDRAPVDITEEIMTSMGGLETLSVISKFGSTFLGGQRMEDDILLHQRAQCLKDQFSVVARFQEDRFDAEAAELERTRNELATEISQLNEYNKGVANKITEMEGQSKKRK